MLARQPRSFRLPAAIATLAVGAALMAPVTTAGAQDPNETFHFESEVAPGRTVIIRNVNGAVRVERAAGSRVQVDARKRWKDGDPSRVRIEARNAGSGGGDLLVCAFWNPEATCDEDGYHSNNNGRQSNGDVSVEFVVQVPEGVLLDLNTVNGALHVTGATARVTARTVNGAIDATSLGGPVDARTVNGSIVARMSTTGAEELSYTTVNGSITVDVPRALDADVELRTVNGRIDSDFPLTLRGRINPRHLTARIGKGGQRLSARTVNGAIRLASGS